MKVSVKFGSTIHVFDNVEELSFIDFKAMVAIQFELEHEFVLTLGSTIMEGEDNQRLADLGIVNGDRLFIVGPDEPAAKRTAASTPAKVPSASSSSQSAMASKKEEPMEVEKSARSSKQEAEKRKVELDCDGINAALAQADARDFIKKAVVLLVWLLEKEGFQIQMRANWSTVFEGGKPQLLHFTCSHEKSVRRPDVCVVAYDANSSSPSAHVQASCSADASRPFSRGVVLRSVDFNQSTDMDTLKALEDVLYWSVINEMKIITLGYGCALLDALSKVDVRLKILGYLDVRSLGRLECTHSAAAQLSRTAVVDRYVWKRLLRQRFRGDGVAAAEKDGKSYREEYQKRVEQLKRGAARVHVPFVDDSDYWRPPNPLVPPTMPDPYFPRNPLSPQGPSNPFDPFHGSLLMPNRPRAFIPGAPRFLPRGGFPSNDPFGRHFI